MTISWCSSRYVVFWSWLSIIDFHSYDIYIYIYRSTNSSFTSFWLRHTVVPMTFMSETRSLPDNIRQAGAKLYAKPLREG